ncbi:GntR family transcriptional regulator [Ramlibacter rhizophilus]|uniref:GntR family transcriptional regulator n=1 Tax=Ramlibacter rhizophilus TaxID=1781167 RepID=A0A4Z0BHB6_9BURK|nr:GntR family transcriptional regulator [Ramlibacter rhizophilus]TFY97789.1 GntR family transcriptional regulator [Ramlibacter rhizophilus]
MLTAIAAPAASEERAYLGLRDLLLAGEIEPGQRLNEVRLAERLGMSRTPVRWALIELEHIGLVEALPAGGFVARRFTPSEVEDAMVLRGFLEGMAARLAAEHGLFPGLRRELQALVAEGAKLVAGEHASPEQQRAYAQVNERFHAGMARASRSEALQRAIDHNNRLPFAAPSAMLPVSEPSAESLFWLRSSQAQHEALLEAIEARQGTRAQLLAEEHARIGRRGLARALQSPERLRALWPGLAKAAEPEPSRHQE